jgi:hypothetical protein
VIRERLRRMADPVALGASEVVRLLMGNQAALVLEVPVAEIAPNAGAGHVPQLFVS